MTTFSVVAICVGVFVALVIAVVGAVKLGMWSEVADFDISNVGSEE